MQNKLIFKKIPIDGYNEGMKIVGCDKEWLNAKIVSSNISNEEMLKILKSYGVKEILVEYISETVALISKEDEISEKSLSNLFLSDLEFVKNIYPVLLSELKEIFQSVKSQRFDPEKVDVITEKINSSSVKNSGFIVNITKYSQNEEYLYNHSINVALLSNISAKNLGYNEKVTFEMTKGGLLHDIGKLFIDTDIVNKKGKLNEHEFAEVKKHPILGYKFLSEYKCESEIVLRIVLEHHERYNGKGYPRRLSGNNISPYAKIASILDAYDALTNDTTYREAMSQEEAIEIIKQSAGAEFSKNVSDILLNFIKNNTLGKVVRLDSDEVGIIVKEGINKKQPLVLIVKDSEGKFVKPYIYDLNSYNAMTGMPYKQIISFYTKKEIDFNPVQILLDNISLLNN